jgi:hypothetical protein
MNNLVNLTIESETPPVLNNVNVLASTDNAIIYVPATAIEAYKSDAMWNNYAERIKGISEL